MGAEEPGDFNPFSDLPSPVERQAEGTRRTGPGRSCPSCGKPLAEDAVVCLACGVDTRTGKRLHTAIVRDEETDSPEPGNTPRRGAPGIAHYSGGSRMPLSVWIPAIVVGINLTSMIFHFGSDFRRLNNLGYCMFVTVIPVGGLILIGFFKAHRLAYQWGIIIGGIVAVLSTGGFALAISDGTMRNVSLERLWSLASPCLIFIPLLTRTAKQYFSLYCPKCGSGSVTPGDFFFWSAKCKKCNCVF